MSDKIRIHIPETWVGVDQVWNSHLLTSEILKHQDQKMLLCVNIDEGFDIRKNGLEYTVKEICDYNNIPYENIEFESGDICQNSDFFKHNYIGYNGDAARYDIVDYHKNYTTPENLFYGQFYVRPDICRLFSFYKHLTFDFKKKGLATMHFDPTNKQNFGKWAWFACEYPDEWLIIKRRLPYSDFDNRFEKTIIDHNNHHDFWHNVYSKIAIEVVAETVTTPGSNFITEKTFRPILHHRLFMIIGSPNCENILKKMGFDIFDDVIDKTYDDKESIDRIVFMYESLRKFLFNDIFIMDKLKSRLEKNNKLMREFLIDNRRKYERLFK